MTRASSCRATQPRKKMAKIFKLLTLLTMLFTTSVSDVLSQERPWVENISRPTDVKNGLQGKHISLWASHGRYYDNKKDVWKWQRPQLYCTSEDVFTQTFTVPYLIPMLENAGAYVFTPRERDWQAEEVIVDNDETDSGYHEEEGEEPWKTAKTNGFAIRHGRYKDFERPFAEGTSRMVATTMTEKETKAYYRPAIHKTGHYAVYVAYQTVEGSVDKAEYTVVHCGERTRFLVNQQMGSGTWVYLGTFFFQSGNTNENYVVLTNKSDRKGYITTDAVRFGGGMGDHERAGRTSGLPRAMEGSRYWAQYAGAPVSAVYCKDGKDDYGEDINARSLMSNWLSYGSRTNPANTCCNETLAAYLDSLTYAEAIARNWADSIKRDNRDSLTDDTITLMARHISDSILGRPFQEINVMRGKVRTGHVPFDMTIGLHSDAGYHEDFSSVYGALTICTTDFNNRKTAEGTTRIKSFDLACNLLHNLQEDLSNKVPQWTTREVWDRNYSESRLPAQESVLLEMLSHESFPDMRLGHDPYFKFLLSRSVYKTILRHLTKRYGKKAVVQPLTPRQFSAGRLRKNILTLSWLPQNDDMEPSAVPTSYNIYMCTGDGDYDNGTNVKGNEYTFAMNENTFYRFRITAVNSGGESFPTEELTAYYDPKAQGTALIVNAFHRLAAPYVVETDSTCGFDLRKDIGVSYGKTPAWVGFQEDFNKKHAGRYPGLGYSDESLLGQFVAGNDFNYAYPHAKALATAGGYNVVSVSSECCDDIKDLSHYGILDIVFGNEKDDGYSLLRGKTFTPAIRQTIEDYLKGDGTLIVSGSYITSDMLCKEDEEWMAEKMGIRHCGVIADSIVTRYNHVSDMVYANGKAFPVYRHINGEHYASVASDILIPATEEKEAIRFATYHTGETAGLIVKNGGKNIVALGFPIECIKEEKDRTEIMRTIIRLVP